MNFGNSVRGYSAKAFCTYDAGTFVNDQNNRRLNAVVCLSQIIILNVINSPLNTSINSVDTILQF